TTDGTLSFNLNVDYGPPGNATIFANATVSTGGHYYLAVDGEALTGNSTFFAYNGETDPNYDFTIDSLNSDYGTDLRRCGATLTHPLGLPLPGDSPPSVYMQVSGDTSLVGHDFPTAGGNGTASFQAINFTGFALTTDGDPWINGQTYDLDNLVPSQYAGDVGLTNIASNGTIATGVLYPGGNFSAPVHTALYLPCALSVDTNNDGNIDLVNDSDLTSPTRPFKFWLNDDCDRLSTTSYGPEDVYSETEQDDLDNSAASVTDLSDGNVDWHLNTIPCQRDLEDFARLWVTIGGLQSAIANGTIMVGLKWAGNITGTPAVKLYQAYESAGGTLYLSDNATATNQITGNYGNAIADVSGAAANSTVIAPTSGDWDFVFPTSVFANLTTANSTTHLLFEGCTAGQGELQIVFLLNNGGTYTKLGGGPGVWLNLQEPAQFVERYTCGDDNGGTASSSYSRFSGSPTFPAPVSDSDKDYVLYVHGYNMDPSSKQRWLETVYKRLYWLGYKGRVGEFSWPCEYGSNQMYFDISERRAWQSAGALYALLGNLTAQGYRVHIIAHSQGNVVASEALRIAGANSGVAHTYIASQAAIASGCFVPDATNITFYTMSDHQTYSPDFYNYYTTSSDAPYMGNATMTGSAGAMVNLYNPNDYALSGDSLADTGWEYAENGKPIMYLYGLTDTGCTYTYNSTVNCFNRSDGTVLTWPANRYEIFSYAAGPWTYPLGMKPSVGVFGSATDLSGSPYDFGSTHIYHSAQFRSSIALRWQYWSNILQTIGVQPHTP
ncbi:MAG: alpha/beta hydrolase, partial [Opitutales bacterium]